VRGWGEREGVGGERGGGVEGRKTLYAHMNKRKKKKKEILFYSFPNAYKYQVPSNVL
jgi:hypothetical protein